MRKKYILPIGLMGFLTVGSQAATILEETFADITGFTFDVNSDGVGGNLTSTPVGGNTLIHEAVDAPGTDNEGTLTRTISTLGFTDITIDFTVSQGVGGTFEGTEFFNIEVDTGSGFTSLSGGPITGLLEDGGTGAANAADVFTLTGEALDAGADDGSFDLRITINTGFFQATNNPTSEEYVLENLVVEGTATVPEPSSTALLGLAGLALVMRRRK